MKNKALALILSSLLAISLTSCSDSKLESAPTEQTVETYVEDFSENAVKVVKSYLEAIVDKGDAAAAVNFMFPADIAEKAFADEEVICEKLFSGEKLKGGEKVNDFKADKIESLNETQLKEAEAFYEKYAYYMCDMPDRDYTVLNGCEITVTAVFKGRGITEDFKHSFVVVDMGDEGIKIATSTASKLEGLAD